MAIRFRCPGCNKSLKAKDHMVGSRVQCPRCDDVLEVPRPTDDSLVGQEQETVAQEMPVEFGAGRKPMPQEEMDMTPMVDVTFLLLIFFMVTAAFTMQKSFEVPAPDDSQPSQNIKTIEELEDDPDYITVRIDSRNEFSIVTPDWIREAPTESELKIQLRQAKLIGNPTGLLVMASGEALHEKVVMVLDAGSYIGMDKVKLVTVDEDEL